MAQMDRPLARSDVARRSATILGQFKIDEQTTGQSSSLSSFALSLSRYSQSLFCRRILGGADAGARTESQVVPMSHQTRRLLINRTTARRAAVADKTAKASNSGKKLPNSIRRQIQSSVSSSTPTQLDDNRLRRHIAHRAYNRRSPRGLDSEQQRSPGRLG